MLRNHPNSKKIMKTMLADKSVMKTIDQMEETNYDLKHEANL